MRRKTLFTILTVYAAVALLVPMLPAGKMASGRAFAEKLAER